MRELTIYEASDGSRHDDAADALTRDNKLRAVSDAMHGLGERPTNDASFTGGFSCLQHDVDAVARSKAALLKLLMGDYAHSLRASNLDRLATADPMSVDFGRGGCLWPIVRGTWIGAAWARLGSIDESGREWASVYYAAHPMPDAVEAGAASPAVEAIKPHDR